MTGAPRVAAIVLAAGGSTRLGQPKQLLPLDDMPLLSRTLELARRSKLAPCIVVLGGYEQEIRAAVPLNASCRLQSAIMPTVNRHRWFSGIQALPDDIDGVVIMLGDQPLLAPGILDTLVDSFQPECDAAVRPRYPDGPGNPILINSKPLSRTAFDHRRRGCARGVAEAPGCDTRGRCLGLADAS